MTPRVRSFIDAVVAFIGLAYLSYFLARAAGDFQSFASEDTLEDMLVGPVLTVLLLPMLCVFSWWSRREQRTLRHRLHEMRADLIT